MRIDPKYFNLFLLIVAGVAALLIAYSMLNNRRVERTAFKERMLSQDSLQTIWWSDVQTGDSLRISDLKGQFVVLDFWSNWSDASLQSHTVLSKIKSHYPDTLQVIAAAVGLQKKEVLSYIQKHDFPFRFVAGSQQFSSLNIPGLPAQLIYNPEGNLQHITLGYPGSSQYDSLRSFLSYEPE